jgi:rare lipoprotein A
VQPRIGHSERGVASWYGDPYHGRRAANGEVYDMERLTAAHRYFAFDTWVRVHNLGNGKSVDVRITDRGPFVDGRVIDLSRAAAREIDMIRAGLAKVRLVVIPPPRIEPQLSEAPSPLATVDAHLSLQRFTVQTGAFRDRENAERFRTKMERRFGASRIVPRHPDGTLWLVVLGDFERIEDAQALAERIRSAGAEALVVPVDAGQLP